MDEKNKGIKIKLPKKLKTVFRAFLVVIVVLLIVFTAAQKFGNVTITTMTSDVKAYFQSLGAGEGFPFKIDASDVRYIDNNNSNLVLLTEKNTQVVNSTAKVIAPEEHNFKNPVMRINGSRAVVYDLDSGKFRIQNSSEVVFEKELENRITAAAVSKKGNYAVGTYGENVQSVFEAYSAKNEKVFAWNFKTERITDISLSDNGKSAAVATLSSSNGVVNSKVYVFDFSSDKTSATIEYPSTAVMRVYYVNGNDVLVIGDNLRSYISNNKKKGDDISFGSDELKAYSVNSDGRSAVILSKYGSSSISELSVYSGKNKKQFSLEFDKGVKWVDCDGKYTAVLFENQVKTYNKKGKEIGNIIFSGEPVRVCVDGSLVYVLTTNNIQCFNTKGTQEAK